MSLIKCPECRKKVSNKAVYCVKCGYPIRKAPKCPISDYVKDIKDSKNKTCTKSKSNEKYDSASTSLFKVAIIMIYGFLALFCIAFIIISYYTLIPLSPVLFTTTAILSFFTLIIFLVSIFDLTPKSIKNQEYLKKRYNHVIGVIFLFSSITLCIINFTFLFILHDDANSVMSFFSFLCIILIALTVSLSKEVWNEKDKNYIISYIALLLTLVLAIVQK